MIEIEYIKIKLVELKLILIYTLVLSMLFSITLFRFSKESSFDVYIFISFYIFIFLLLYLRSIFMKIIAYKNGFEIEMRNVYVDRYGLRFYDKISYYQHNIKHNLGYKGIPMWIICILIYIFTLGLLIFPSIWNYKYKKIEHMFFGTRQAWEYTMGQMYNIGISDYRKSKAFFAGFLFYFIILLFLKIFTIITKASIFNWFSFILIWIAIITILPIPGTEGFSFWQKNNFAWIMATTIMILGMICIFIFQSLFYVITMSIFSSLVVIFFIFYKKIMGGSGSGH